MAADLRRGENIDVYVTIVVALVVAVLNLVGLFPASGLTSLVLAVLGLLAISGLTTRARLDQLRDVVVQGGPGPAQAAFPASYQEDLTKPGDIWLIVSRAAASSAAISTSSATGCAPGTRYASCWYAREARGAVLAEQRLPVVVPGVMDKSIQASLELLDGLRSRPAAAWRYA